MCRKHLGNVYLLFCCLRPPGVDVVVDRGWSHALVPFPKFEQICNRTGKISSVITGLWLDGADQQVLQFIGVNRPAIVRKIPHFGLFPAFPHFCENVPHFWLYFEITKIAENRNNFPCTETFCCENGNDSVT